MQLMNIRYKCVEDFGVDDFVKLILNWTKNTTDLRYKMNIEETEFSGYSVYKDGEKELSIVEHKEVKTIAALHKDKDLYGTEFVLSTVFKPEEHEIFIRMTNSKSTEGGKFMVNFRKPDLIDELVDEGILDMDYDVEMLYDYHNVSKGNTEEFLSILNRKAKFTLPVIYIALGPCNVYAVDPEELASNYAGMAHVFCQDHRDCFDELINGTTSYVPKNGEVAIYYPKDNPKEVHLNFNKYYKKGMDNAISKAIHFYYHNQNFGQMTTYDEIAAKAISIRNSNLKLENNEVYEENARVHKENKEIIDTFDQDLRKSDEEMEKIKRRMRELEKENEILRKRLNSSDSSPLLYYGQEKELYVGEIKEILIDVLSNISFASGSRRQHIIDDLLKTNAIKSTLKDRYAKVKSAFNDYREMDSTTRAELEELGFVITSDGKHHKLTYHNDSRYQFSIPKTSSDYRSGLNAISYIIKNMM